MQVLILVPWIVHLPQCLCESVTGVDGDLQSELSVLLRNLLYLLYSVMSIVLYFRL
jgi:hypothetical protein